jgi:branched-chain amino acid transport system permease protein
MGCLVVAALCCFAPMMLDAYCLNLVIQIGYFAIVALGLNLVVGYSGQISMGQSAFFGFGAFASAWLSSLGVPVLLSIPLAGIATGAIGLVFGLPAVRIRGLYLAIATLSAQYILQDFFARASGFTGGSAGTPAQVPGLFGIALDGDHRYFYLVLCWSIGLFVAAANLLRTRTGRALVAVRDHHLAAEMMGINLARYRVLAFGLSAFYAGIGGALYGHHLGFVSAEAFTVLLSVQFLAMVIIGGPGSLSGSLLGAAFMVLLPELMNAAVATLHGSRLNTLLNLHEGLAFLREMAMGAVIILFLLFEPGGLAHCWGRLRQPWASQLEKWRR